MGLSSYDRWLTHNPADDFVECPRCGAACVEDAEERTIDCTGCDWGQAHDWDRERDR